MKKTIILSFFISFFFVLPGILSNFTYMYIVDKMHYYLIYFIVAIISFFVFILGCTLNFFTKKYIIKIIWRSSFSVFLTLLSAFSGNVILHKVLLKDLPHGANYLKFNMEQWQENEMNNTSIRQYMLKDIVRNILPGKSKNEIETILGMPNSIYADKIEYIAGQERGYISIDLEILQLFFDENDIYTHYKITFG